MGQMCILRPERRLPVLVRVRLDEALPHLPIYLPWWVKGRDGQRTVIAYLLSRLQMIRSDSVTHRGKIKYDS